MSSGSQRVDAYRSKRLPVPSGAGPASPASLALSPTVGGTAPATLRPLQVPASLARIPQIMQNGGAMRGSWLTTRLTLVLCLGAALAQAQPARTSEATAGAPSASARPASAEAPGSSPEDPRERARSLGYSGVRAYGAGDYAAAHEQLEQAFSLVPVPSLGLWSARTLVKLNRWVDAERRYREVARLHVEADAPPVQRQAQATVQQELLALLPRIPTLRVRIEGARPEDVVLSLDGVELPAERWTRGEPVDPGPHSISGTHHVSGTHVSGTHVSGTRHVSGTQGERSTVEITAVEGREREVLLRFTPVPLAAPAAVPEVIASAPSTPAASVSLPDTEDSSPRTQRLAGWIGVGAGVAGLTLSGVSYFVARSQKEQLQCDDQGCAPGRRLDAYNRMRTLYLVSLVAGGVMGAVGVGLLLFEPEPDQGTSSSGQVAVRLGLGGAELVGSF